MDTRLAVGALLICVLLAGCAGSLADPQDTQSSESTEFLDIVAYENLSTEGQQHFDRLRSGGTLTGIARDFPHDFWYTEYISYESTVYKLEKEPIDWVAIRGLSIKTVDPSSVGNESAVIPFEELTPEARDVFNRSRTRAYETRDYPPGQLVGTYIRFQNKTYRSTVIHADVTEMRLSLNKTNI